MPATGELIRMMNYVDDITATLRRVIANVPYMTEEEKRRLAEDMHKADPSFDGLMQRLEKESK